MIIIINLFNNSFRHLLHSVRFAGEAYVWNNEKKHDVYAYLHIDLPSCYSVPGIPSKLLLGGQVWLPDCVTMNDDDNAVDAVEQAMKEWAEKYKEAARHVQLIEACGICGGTGDANNLPRLNATAQDCLAALRSLQFQLDLLAQQQPTDEQIESCRNTLQTWKDQYQSLHLNLRNANLQAKSNIRKAAQEERELLLGGGEESTIRRRNLQPLKRCKRILKRQIELLIKKMMETVPMMQMKRTKAGMTAAAESITESLRRTRQMMVQEVERGVNTLTTLDHSGGTLRKAESEYKGHRSLLMSTRRLLTVMRRQDVLDRIILAAGFLFFALAVLYIFTKRIGLLKLQRKLSAFGRTEVTDANVVSDTTSTDKYRYATGSPYPINDEIRLDIGNSERKDGMDANPNFMDKTAHQTASLNQVNNDAMVGMRKAKEEPTPTLTHNDLSLFSKNLPHEIHDEL